MTNYSDESKGVDCSCPSLASLLHWTDTTISRDIHQHSLHLALTFGHGMLGSRSPMVTGCPSYLVHRVSPWIHDVSDVILDTTLVPISNVAN